MVPHVHVRYPRRSARAALFAGLALLIASAAHAAGVEVYSFGANDENGQGVPGPGFNPTATPIDTTNLADKTITQVSAGGIHTLLLADDGSVYSFGSNTFGRTGQGTQFGVTLIADQIDTSNLGGKKITQVSAGFDFSLLLAEDGTVYSFGNNGNGRTAQGTISGNTATPTQIFSNPLGGRKIKEVSAGQAHGLLLAEDGTVFAFGVNTFGRTGLGVTTATNTLLPTAIDTTNLAGETIAHISASTDHSLLLTEDGDVFAFGTNNDGHTGLGTTAGSTPTATRIDTTHLGGRAIKQIETASFHSLLLAEDGTVFAFGDNGDGRTGQGFSAGETTVATPIVSGAVGSRAITDISAASSYNLVLAEDGTAIAWGTALTGRSGLGPGADDALLPTPIDDANLDGLTVLDIDAGGQHGFIRVAMLLAGDTDGDGDIDDFDLLAAIANYTGSLPAGTGGKGLPEGDTDADQDVDDFDLLAMISGYTGSLPTPTVPEPAGMGLLTLAGLLLVRRRVC